MDCRSSNLVLFLFLTTPFPARSNPIDRSIKHKSIVYALEMLSIVLLNSGLLSLKAKRILATHSESFKTAGSGYTGSCLTLCAVDLKSNRHPPQQVPVSKHKHYNMESSFTLDAAPTEHPLPWLALRILLD